MKKSIVLLALLLSFLFMRGQNICGNWNGTTTTIQGNQLRIVFHISKTKSGYFTTMNCPDQKAYGILSNSTEFNNPVLKIKVPQIGISYEGTLNENGKFVGVLVQSSKVFPLDLHKGGIEANNAERPEKKLIKYNTYSYFWEDVSFTINKNQQNLKGTLTIPFKKSLSPVIILIRVCL